MIEQKGETWTNPVTTWRHCRPIVAEQQNIVGAGTTTVLDKPGQLVGVTINRAISSGVITIYDSLSASGTLVGTITLPTILLESFGKLTYNCRLATGLTIVTVGANLDITVLYI